MLACNAPDCMYACLIVMSGFICHEVKASCGWSDYLQFIFLYTNI